MRGPRNLYALLQYYFYFIFDFIFSNASHMSGRELRGSPTQLETIDVGGPSLVRRIE